MKVMSKTNKNGRKLIFYDIDGTLIDQNTHRIPSSALKAMEQARERGCLNLINTGRTLCNRDPRLDRAPIDGWVMGCGTRIILGGETLMAFSRSEEESRRIRALCREIGLSVVYEADEAIWMEAEYPDAEPQILRMREFSEKMCIGRTIPENGAGFSFIKMFTFDREGHRIQKLLEMLEGRFEAIRRTDTGAGWELVPKGYSKGTGIDAVRKKLGVPLEDCYVIGDSQNDLTMLTHVPNSIAMGNAEPEVQAVCAYVTAPVEEDGIAKALAHFSLAEWPEG